MTAAGAHIDWNEDQSFLNGLNVLVHFCELFSTILVSFSQSLVQSQLHSFQYRDFAVIILLDVIVRPGEIDQMICTLQRQVRRSAQSDGAPVKRFAGAAPERRLCRSAAVGRNTSRCDEVAMLGDLEFHALTSGVGNWVDLSSAFTSTFMIGSDKTL